MKQELKDMCSDKTKCHEANLGSRDTDIMFAAQ